MKIWRVLYLCGSLAAVPFASQGADSEAEQADLVLTGGKIYTPQGWQEAIAIRDGVIVAMGVPRAMAPYRGKKTRTLDLKGKTVLPGLHDSHVHAINAGILAKACVIPHNAQPQALLDIVVGCAAKRKPGEWIKGRAFSEDLFVGAPPHRSMLDKVAPNNPVYLVDISGHTAWANTAALKLFGIDRNTVSPEGGVIEHDASGEPTGILRENARNIATAVMGQPSREEMVAALKQISEQMLSYGITAFTDAGVQPEEAAAFAALYDLGGLKQRVRVCMRWGRGPDVIASRSLYERPNMTFDCVKIQVDGVPTSAKTAVMLEPYEHQVAGAEPVFGLPTFPVQDIKDLVTQWDARGFTVKMHASGDGAVRISLDAIEQARLRNGYSGRLHDVAHVSFAHMEDLKRARTLGAVFEISPYLFHEQPIMTDIAGVVGAEQMNRWIPVKDALNLGALVTIGSDLPVVESFNPWVALETLVTRSKPGGGGAALAPQERISLQQALDLFTINGARQVYRDNLTGSIEIGKLADLVVIDRNVFDIPITEVHKTVVDMTLIGGQVVFQRAAH